MSKYLQVQRQHIHVSLKRLLKKMCWLYKVVNQRQGKSICQGDPFEYYTFKDLFWVEKGYQDFLLHGNTVSLDRLIKKLYKLHYKRAANLYLVFGLYPKMISRLC